MNLSLFLVTHFPEITGISIIHKTFSLNNLSLYGPILVSFGKNSLANTPLPAFLMDDNFTMTSDGTDILVNTFEASSHP